MQFFLSIFFVLWVVSPASAQNLRHVQVPNWVDVADMDEMAPALYDTVQNGEKYRLVDRQMRWVGATRETYVRVATEAVNQSGLDAVATVSRDYDPNSETLTMVRLDLIRDGKRESLIDLVNAEFIRREARLERGIIDETLTVHMAIPGARVGDIVDAAFIWRTDEYFPGYNLAGRYQMEFSVPVGLNRVVVNWPNERPLRLRAPSDQVVASVSVGAVETRYEWRAKNQPARLLQEHTPSEYNPWDAVEFSGFQSWNDVAAALSDYYVASYSVPAPWQDQLRAISDKYESDGEKAFVALRLVQDNIRYVGLEVGAGGYFARDPATVAANAFGDCKDKSLLLVTMLNALGIDAFVALASLNEGYGVIDRLPSVQTFDHMIVGAKIGADIVWMDPTAQFEGGNAQTATQPDLGYVLPLTDDGLGLVKIDIGQVPQFQREMTETFWFSFAGAILNVETVLKGASANAERSFWAKTPVSSIATDYLAYYALSYPGVRAVRAPVMTDARDSNKITVSESYLIARSQLLNPALYREFRFSSANNIDEFPQQVATERRDPMAVQPGLRLVHNVRIRNAPIEFNAPENSQLGGPAFSHNFSANSWAGGNMDMSWKYETRARSVPATAVRDVIGAMKDARRLGAFSWDFQPVK